MNVLLVRADGIGDALVCAPLVAALQAAGHDVGAVMETRNRDAFAEHAFARVHVLERIPWPAHGSTPASRATALAAVRAARYDVCLIASEEPDAYRFARDARIAERIGFSNGWRKPLKSLAVRLCLTSAVVRPASARAAREHEARTLFALGAGFIAEAEPTRDVGRLRALVIGAGTRERSHAIALQVSHKLARAGLGRDAFVACARRLRARGDDVLVLGDDESFVRDVAVAGAARAAYALDVRGWKSRIASARALITGDSGAAHVAGMTGVPTVDAFALGAATVSDIRRWAPWAAPYRALVLDPSRTPEATASRLVAALDDVLAA